MKMLMPVTGKTHECRKCEVEKFTPDEITEQHGHDKWAKELGHGAGVVQLTGRTWCWRGPETDWRYIFLRAV